MALVGLATVTVVAMILIARSSRRRYALAVGGMWTVLVGGTALGVL